jgi:hypothetical protein
LDLIEIEQHLESGGSVKELDVGEIIELANMLPANGVIDMNIAEELCTAFLRGSSAVSDLIEVVARYEGRAESRKKSARARAMYDRAKQAGLTTAKDREAFADDDKEYLQRNDYWVDLVALRKWLEQKHEFFIRSHYLAKAVWSSGKKQEPLGAAPASKCGEEDWA